MSGMKDDLATLQSQHPGYELWVGLITAALAFGVSQGNAFQITGHSLGGAMASLAASHISYNKLFPVNKVPLRTQKIPAQVVCI